MAATAVEIINLEKKFPQKPKRKHNENDDRQANGGAKRRIPFFHAKREKVWITAVDKINLQIRQGEIFGLLGPNGAGKTTTIRMLCTLLEPTNGTAMVNGFDIVREARLVRQSLGTVLAGDRSIYWKLTGRENLQYFAALYHIPPEIARKRIDELLAHMELTERANDLVEKYSTGMKQRIAISKALIARPPIILLDEPTLGLDPQAARKVRELISGLKDDGHTVLLTTHYMEEADQLSDRIGIIDQGKIIALDSADKLKDRIQQHDAIKLEVAGWDDTIGQAVENIPGIEKLLARYMGSDSLWEVNIHTPESKLVLPRIIETVNQNGTRLVNMNVLKPTLEDVFIDLTGKALRE